MENPPATYVRMYRCESTGYAALKGLSFPATGRVTGSTSKGIFVLIPPQRVFFLSYESYRGPLTLNLTPRPAEPLPVYIGQEVHVEADEISLPTLNTHITLSEETLWLPPAPPANILPNEDLWASIKRLSESALYVHRGVGLVPMLAFIMDDPHPPTIPAMLQSTIANILILKNLFTQPVEVSMSALTALMGTGRGLTPSGDDFIVGLMLLLSRMPGLNSLHDTIEALHRQVVEIAFEKTTALSANLIACACEGSADERLIRAVDGFLTGSLNEAGILHTLQEYGSSSGVDALTGIASGMRALQAVRAHH
ncbi:MULTISPECIES: DUF2877 domain-containing protein [Anaerolinea]|uniref:DUF2877 domain-containing protein n=1 Tax=Anaerolinea TaxID=233189 RepID=UPI0026129A79|nr:DUF2877 domain-containing protein [Anaerolinea thermophila]